VRSSKAHEERSPCKAAKARAQFRFTLPVHPHERTILVIEDTPGSGARCGPRSKRAATRCSSRSRRAGIDAAAVNDPRDHPHLGLPDMTVLRGPSHRSWSTCDHRAHRRRRRTGKVQTLDLAPTTT